jgi:hypothetical protein
MEACWFLGSVEGGERWQMVRRNASFPTLGVTLVTGVICEPHHLHDEEVSRRGSIP